MAAQMKAQASYQASVASQQEVANEYHNESLKELSAMKTPDLKAVDEKKYEKWDFSNPN